MKFPDNLHLITDEVAAIVAVVCFHFVFLCVAVWNREKFCILEFYLFISFVYSFTLGLVWLFLGQIHQKQQIAALKQRIRLLTTGSDEEDRGES